ncbi:MAG: metallophosphoesterase [Paenibacillus sp.]|uniref:metallophosphoesterase family protein n=1 Tax=Paenibacillus sp. GCM10012303 TaxID=3317340 RepID=UPI0029E99D92|nr:metallophosphoesterase [Paenibacillus sp.]
MSRRGFMKWLFAAFAVIAGSFYALFQLLTRVGTQPSAPPAVADIVVPMPKSEPAPAQDVKPVISAEPLLSFFLFSDLHISLYDPATSQKLKQALDDVTKLESKVEAIVFTGDLTDYGTDAEYNALEAILKDYKLPPIYGNMGNHDYYRIWIDKNGGFARETMPNGQTDAESRARFQKMFNLSKPYSDVTIHGYHLIMMSQETYVQEQPDVGEGAWYSDEQLEWLRAKLKETKDNKPIFVMIHQPLPPEGQDGGTHRVIRAKAFREILKPYPNVFVFSGHTHQDFENGSSHYSKESFHWFVNSSVGRTSNRSFQQEAKDKTQGLYVQVYEDRVVLRGREFSQKSFITAADWTIPLERAKVEGRN